MKTSPKISIVVPSFNSEKYIKDTLDSIFVQKYPNLEVIVQDGGSNDGTVGILKKFKKKYPRQFKYETKKDKGQADAVNKGLKNASGEIVTFLNSDDVYETGAFQQVALSYYNNPDALWFAGTAKIVDMSGREFARFWTLCKNILLYLNSYTLLLITSNYLSQPSVFLTRKAYRKFGPIPAVEKYVFEYDLWLKIGKVKMPQVIKSNLSSFRLTTNNASSTFHEKILKHDLEVVNKHTNNPIVVWLHKLNNLARVLVVKFVK